MAARTKCWKQSLLVWLRVLITAFLFWILAGVGMKDEPATGRNDQIHSDRLWILLTFLSDPRLVKGSILFWRAVVILLMSSGLVAKITVVSVLSALLCFLLVLCRCIFTETTIYGTLALKRTHCVTDVQSNVCASAWVTRALNYAVLFCVFKHLLSITWSLIWLTCRAMFCDYCGTLLLYLLFALSSYTIVFCRP